MITQSAVQKPSEKGSSQTLPIPASPAQPHYLPLLRSLPLCGNGSEKPITTLGITSCYSGEGVSTIAAQLSVAAVSAGMRTLLVDSNWKRPTVHKTFAVPCSPGLTEALAGDGWTAPPVQSTHFANLSVLTAGVANQDFNLANSLEKIDALIRSLQMDYDLVVFDLPESAQSSTSLALSGLLDGVLLVVESERVRWEVALRVKELLVRSGANVVGTVLNKRRQRIPDWLYRTV